MGILRIILAVHVVFSHLDSDLLKSYADGGLAVQIFFIISGFYISFIYIEKYSKLSKSYFNFITNRFIRIFPAYWFTYLIFVMGNVFLEQSISLSVLGIGPEIKSLGLCISMLAMQLFIFGQDIITFLKLNLTNNTLSFIGTSNENLWGLHKLMFNPPSWSLAIELTFYLVAPFLFNKNKILITLLVSSILLRIFTWNYLNLNFDPWLNRFFPQEIACFIAGYFAYLFYRKYLVNYKKYFNMWLIFSLIVLLLIFEKKLYTSAPQKFNYTTLYFSTLVVFSFALPFLFRLFQDNKMDVFIGRFSFPIYLSHIPAFRFWNSIYAVKGLDPVYGKLLYTMILVFLIFLFEIPIQRFREKRIQQKLASNIKIVIG